MNKKDNGKERDEAGQLHARSMALGHVLLTVLTVAVSLLALPGTAAFAVPAAGVSSAVAAGVQTCHGVRAHTTLSLRRKKGISPRGVIGRFSNNKIVKTIEQEEAEELRTQVAENTGNSVIEQVDGPLTRMATDLLNRVDDSVLMVVKKGATLAEKSLPSVQGVVAKLQSPDDIAYGVVNSLGNVLSQDQLAQVLVDAPLHFSQFVVPLITGGGWEYAVSSVAR